ncbi:MAG: NAD(P)H-dependent oxidoreductase subunit E [Giesbergeria sp.]
MGLSPAIVEGVASFYRFFHLQPVGRYHLLWSDNVTDRMQGSHVAGRRPAPAPEHPPTAHLTPAAWPAWGSPLAPAWATRARLCW